MDVLFYSKLPSNRLAYIVSFLFDNLLGASCILSNNIGEYQSFNGIKINYSDSQISTNELWIKPHTLLFEQGIKEQKIEINFISGLAILFAEESNTDFNFDPFASSFYLLSRYEEYLPYKKDKHGRFSASQSLAYKSDFIEQPIIHLWLKQLVIALQKKYATFKPKPTIYAFKPTYDIDIPWAFKHRGIRGWLRAGLDLTSAKWPLIKARYQVQIGQKRDPFYCFEHLKSQHAKYGIQPQIFWLIGNASKEDINPDYQLTVFQNLIRSTAAWSNSGLHPSYQSNKKLNLLQIEKTRLENILQQTITHSRQHFLKLRLPQTYRQLLKAGIQHDYSMGFADSVGYRAGTSEAFFWYDLEKETRTGLQIHPFVAMDVTLRQYFGFSPDEAKKKLKELQDFCKKNGLTFSTLWHNSSFSSLHGWEGWDAIYWKLFE